MAESYDVIVIGTGGVGTSALYHLAKRGVRVLGLDRFPPAHDRGSSHGRTRVIRQAYFEHPDYVPLLLRAYQLWAELSEKSGNHLYHEIGVLQVGPPNGTVVPGVLQAAATHGLAVDRLSAKQTTKQFPAFRVPETWEAAFERRAGYLAVEDCVMAHLEQAKTAKAAARYGVTVKSCCADDDRAMVETDAGNFSAARLVIAAGAWAGSLLAELGIRLEVRRKAAFWYPAPFPALHADHGCPVYLFETPAGVFYGIPQVDEFGFKVAEHSGGQPVDDPLRVHRELNPIDQSRVESFLSVHVPSVGRPFLHHNVCLYTMSPDENFIVDVHPKYPHVCFAAGLSGHGFKFTSVLGEVLADLALNGRTNLPIGFLSCRRFESI